MQSRINNGEHDMNIAKLSTNQIERLIHEYDSRGEYDNAAICRDELADRHASKRGKPQRGGKRVLQESDWAA